VEGLYGHRGDSDKLVWLYCIDFDGRYCRTYTVLVFVNGMVVEKTVEKTDVEVGSR
jgi:hypothetical protein